MENLLAKTIIEATRVNQTDIALERMTNIAARKNLNAQQDLVSSQTSRLNDLQDNFNSLNHSVNNKDLEIRQLREKLRIAINMYEEANDNTGSWIELLNQPLHIIAKKHSGFNENFNSLLLICSRIVLENLARSELIDSMAEKLEYTDLEKDIMKNRFEEIILKNLKGKDKDLDGNEILIKKFHNKLVDDIKEDKKELRKK